MGWDKLCKYFLIWTIVMMRWWLEPPGKVVFATGQECREPILSFMVSSWGNWRALLAYYIHSCDNLVYLHLKEHPLHLEHEVLSDKRIETVIKALFILQSVIYCVYWSNINIPLKFVLVTPGYRPHKNIISNKSEPSLNCWVVPELCADNWGHKQHFAASLVK